MIRWILLLQEFNLTIEDKKGVENVVVDHLSCLEFKNDTEILPIQEAFPYENLFAALGSLSHRHMMPLNPILVVEIFDCWGINFM